MDCVICGRPACVNAFMGESPNGDLGRHPSSRVALGLLLRIPDSQFPRGRTAKISWIVLSGGLTAFVDGFWIPIGLLVAIGIVSHYGHRQSHPDQARPHVAVPGDHGYPFYPDGRPVASESGARISSRELA